MINLLAYVLINDIPLCCAAKNHISCGGSPQVLMEWLHINMFQRLFINEDIDYIEQRMHESIPTVHVGLKETLHLILHKYQQRLINNTIPSDDKLEPITQQMRNFITPGELYCLDQIVPQNQNIYEFAAYNHNQESEALKLLKNFAQNMDEKNRIAFKNYFVVRSQKKQKISVDSTIVFPDILQEIAILMFDYYELGREYINSTLYYLFPRMQRGMTQEQLIKIIHDDNMYIVQKLQEVYCNVMNKLLPVQIIDDSKLITSEENLNQLIDAMNLECIQNISEEALQLGKICFGIQNVHYDLHDYVPKCEYLPVIQFTNQILGKLGINFDGNSHQLFFYFLSNIYNSIRDLKTTYVEFVKLLNQDINNKQIQQFRNNYKPEINVATACHLINQLVFDEESQTSFDQLEKEYFCLKEYIREKLSNAKSDIEAQLLKRLGNLYLTQSSVAKDYVRLFIFYIELLVEGYNCNSVIQFVMRSTGENTK